MSLTRKQQYSQCTITTVVALLVVPRSSILTLCLLDVRYRTVDNRQSSGALAVRA
ncbi:hypothetical protein [Amycolatopsis sp. NPDC054798]